MKCPDCRDTGQITLFTTIGACTSCDIATVSRYILGDLREPNEDPHYPEMEPLLQAVQRKTSRALRLLINDALYTTIIESPHNIAICPRNKHIMAWAYKINAPDVYMAWVDSTVIDDDDYVIVEIVHVDRQKELRDEMS